MDGIIITYTLELPQYMVSACIEASLDSMEPTSVIMETKHEGNIIRQSVLYLLRNSICNHTTKSLQYVVPTETSDKLCEPLFYAKGFQKSA